MNGIGVLVLGSGMREESSGMGGVELLFDLSPGRGEVRNSTHHTLALGRADCTAHELPPTR